MFRTFLHGVQVECSEADEIILLVRHIDRGHINITKEERMKALREVHGRLAAHGYEAFMVWLCKQIGEPWEGSAKIAEEPISTNSTTA